ncbi:TusE/DsrC/DsvC family sulfur relay protein [Corynebacterium hansenii]|uniref:TusE/DsrC/DsvC family sulfur relay protein n=1 Tax=Corynebacterium hansenii TaxID=394964 RepID=A0ABV7ZRL7_9CORY|nr:TusE/DsrC/DsvC family sulfur relay protein [Corynebacterium hansenii]WJZ00621.1 NADH dehydrogenase-like protein YjlD [Corynebacterium hansenii]
MTRLLILGGGTAGTIAANKLRKAVPAEKLSITVVDADDRHPYQPGYLFLPFGKTSEKGIAKPRSRQFAKGIDFILGDIDRVDVDAHEVTLADGRTLGYDKLIIATGTSPRPDMTPGMDSDDVHHFYDLDGAIALKEALRYFRGGRMVVHIAEMPIKCPVAPMEFAFLADSWLREKGLRERTALTYVTPLDGAFTKPVASRELGGALDERQIEVETDFAVERIDGDRKMLVGFDGREIPFDLLVTVPVNMGAEFVARSGIGDEGNYVPCDPHTMRADASPDVYVLGDAGTLPTSKAGAVAHFSIDVFTENFLAELEGREPTAKFDGHANCFVETGDGMGMLLDFNYEVEPLTGTFPVPRVGPMRLLGESRLNHWGKLAFEWIYWNILLKGRPLPLPPDLSMRGKIPAGQSAGRGATRPDAHGPRLDISPRAIPRNAPVASAAPASAAPVAAAPVAAAATPAAPGTAGEAAPHGDEAVATDAAPAAPTPTAAVDVPSESAPNPDWTPELAAQRAADLGIDADDTVLAIAEFLRDDYAARRQTPTLRRVATVGGYEVKQLFTIFPGKPAKKMAWIAGLPKPKGCV